MLRFLNRPSSICGGIATMKKVKFDVSVRLRHVSSARILFHFIDYFRSSKIVSLINTFLYGKFQTGKVLAIRREDQSVWERRAPFSPSNVRRLVKSGIKVIVQPSNRRSYPMQVFNLYFFLNL